MLDKNKKSGKFLNYAPGASGNARLNAEPISQEKWDSIFGVKDESDYDPTLQTNLFEK